MSVGIYKITNPNGKIYIGQSTDIEKRFKYYYRLECKGQTKIFNSLKKYGPENHVFEIIEECSIEQLNEREIYWGLRYKVLNENGLNLKELGIGGKWNDEMKRKFREKRNSKEWKSFISSIHVNKKVSDSTREKQRNARLNIPQSQTVKEKRGIYNKHSEEHIQKFIKSKSKSIICLNDNKEYNSIKEAENILGIDHSNIIKVLKGIKKDYKGLIFKYKKEI
jgi:group I intron endonuclease